MEKKYPAEKKEKKYLTEKKKKKKSAMNGVAVLVVLALIFIFIIAKFALSGGGIDDTFTGAPSADEVYAIAKIYVKPTLKAPDATFSDSQYQFGKKEDSVYVIKSHVDMSGGQQTNFEIVLKYKGGAKNDERNWAVLNLNED